MDENEEIHMDYQLNKIFSYYDENDKKKKNICDSYYFVFSFYLFESLIYFGCFYLFYTFKIGDKNNKIYQVLEFSLLGILALFYILFGFIFLFIYEHDYKKYSNLTQFILISLFKLCFFTFVYLMTALSGNNDRISYPYFEARAYWKISMSVFYLSFIFYQYFKKDKYSEKIPICIIIPIASILIYFFLTFFTQRKSDNWDRLWIHIIYLGLEIYFTMIVLFIIRSEENRQKKEHLEPIKILDWKINEIDLFRYMIALAPLIFAQIKECYNSSRFCREIRRNFS